MIGLAIIIMYPTGLIMKFREESKDIKGMDEIIFFMNWAGVYHHYDANATNWEII